MSNKFLHLPTHLICLVYGHNVAVGTPLFWKLRSISGFVVQK